MTKPLCWRIVARMLEDDAFSQWMGVVLVEVEPGQVDLQMKVRPDMVNGLGRCHGGVLFAFADSALAFASNSRGRVAFSVDNSISYPHPVSSGDVLTARARELSAGQRLAFYRVEVENQERQLVGLFRGTVYRTSQQFETAEGDSDGT